MKTQTFTLTSLFIISSATLFLVSCKKDQNISNTPGINYQLQTTNRTSTVGKVESGNIVWTSGYGNATEVKFDAKGPSGDVEYKSSSNQRIDLFSGISSLSNVTLPAGTYKEVEFKVELNPTATEPALLLNGNYSSTGPAVPIIFSISTPLEIETEMNDVTVANNSSYKALTDLNLSTLTTGITQNMIDNASKTNGSIIINSSSNVSLYNIIIANFKASEAIEFKKD